MSFCVRVLFLIVKVRIVVCMSAFTILTHSRLAHHTSHITHITHHTSEVHIEERKQAQSGARC